MTLLQRTQIESLISQSKKTLGEGQYGLVYLVPWEDFSAVLKVSKDSDENLDIFMEEADILERLDGAGGAPILLGYAEDPPALLMTQVGRLTLHQILYEYYDLGFDNWGLGIKAGHQLLEIHEKDVIHNDFKSDNIIVTGTIEEPEVKIIDFGLACEEDGSLGLDSNQSDFPWIAPEVTQGGLSTKASDVYSFGFLMSEISETMPWDPSLSMNMVDLALKDEPSERPTLKELLEHLEAAEVKQTVMQ